MLYRSHAFQYARHNGFSSTVAMEDISNDVKIVLKQAISDIGKTVRPSFLWLSVTGVVHTFLFFSPSCNRCVKSTNRG